MPENPSAEELVRRLSDDIAALLARRLDRQPGLLTNLTRDVSATVALVDAERLECCKAVCLGCLEGKPIVRGYDGLYYHLQPDGSRSFCYASEIRRRWPTGQPQSEGGEL